jgi:hypothetical protein
VPNVLTTDRQNLFDPADNLESNYAREALTRWYHLLHQGKLTSITFADFCERTGLQLEHEGCLTDNLPPIQRWLNRILALPIALQNAVFDEFLGLLRHGSMRHAKRALSMPVSRPWWPTS